MFQSTERARAVGRRAFQQAQLSGKSALESTCDRIRQEFGPVRIPETRKNQARKILANGFRDFYVQAWYGRYLKEIIHLIDGDFRGAVKIIAARYQFERAQFDRIARVGVSTVKSPDQSRIRVLLLALRYLRRFGEPVPTPSSQGASA